VSCNPIMHKCSHEGLFGWQHDTAGASACNDDLMLAIAACHPWKFAHWPQLRKVVLQHSGSTASQAAASVELMKCRLASQQGYFRDKYRKKKKHDASHCLPGCSVLV